LASSSGSADRPHREIEPRNGAGNLRQRRIELHRAAAGKEHPAVGAAAAVRILVAAGNYGGGAGQRNVSRGDGRGTGDHGFRRRRGLLWCNEGPATTFFLQLGRRLAETPARGRGGRFPGCTCRRRPRSSAAEIDPQRAPAVRRSNRIIILTGARNIMLTMRPLSQATTSTIPIMPLSSWSTA
jgi:hypothetical protein